MAELTAIGPEPQHHWQNPLTEGATVRLGRAPREGWSVPWDPKISREHVDIIWAEGQLLVQCLELARNPVLVGDKKGTEFTLQVGDSFRIGDTSFVLSEESEGGATDVEEITLGSADRQETGLTDAPRQMELISKLPEIIAETRDDEELATRLTTLLLEALPRAEAAAIVRYGSVADLEAGKRPSIRWESRGKSSDRFSPSLRLVRTACLKQHGVLHLWSGEGAGNQNYTMTGGLDWALCTPVPAKSADGWCLYVAGKSAGDPHVEELRAGLQFMELVSQFIGSVRQVRAQEKLQAGMRKFLSPSVVKSLGGESNHTLLTPKISDVTVMLCDVRGHSKMADDTSVDLFPLLNRISQALTTMTRSIAKFEGAIADFQGDMALGFWGWPVTLDEGALPAFYAALAIHERFCQAKSDPEHPLCGFRIGIGLAQGRGIAGRIGTGDQFKVGVYGPVVSLGSQLQRMTKQLRCSILIDEATAQQAREGLKVSEGRCRQLGKFRPDDTETALVVSELLPAYGSWSNLAQQDLIRFESGVEAVAGGDWPRARGLFNELPGDDGPTKFYLELLTRHNDTPPADWTGVIALPKGV